MTRKKRIAVLILSMVMILCMSAALGGVGSRSAYDVPSVRPVTVSDIATVTDIYAGDSIYIWERTIGSEKSNSSYPDSVSGQPRPAETDGRNREMPDSAKAQTDESDIPEGVSPGSGVQDAAETRREGVPREQPDGMLIRMIPLTERARQILKTLEAGSLKDLLPAGLGASPTMTVVEVLSIRADGAIEEYDTYTVEMDGLAGVKSGDRVSVYVETVSGDGGKAWHAEKTGTAGNNRVRVTFSAETLKAMARAICITAVVVKETK